MGHDQACGIHPKRKCDQFSQIKQDGRVRAAIDCFVPTEPHFIIEKEGVHEFALLAHAQLHKEGGKIVGALHRLAELQDGTGKGNRTCRR